jgi:hypothetical protein
LRTCAAVVRAIDRMMPRKHDARADGSSEREGARLPRA